MVRWSHSLTSLNLTFDDSESKFFDHLSALGALTQLTKFKLHDGGA